jgi:hypothetical protein
MGRILPFSNLQDHKWATCPAFPGQPTCPGDQPDPSNLPSSFPFTSPQPNLAREPWTDTTSLPRAPHGIPEPRLILPHLHTLLVPRTPRPPPRTSLPSSFLSPTRTASPRSHSVPTAVAYKRCPEFARALTPLLSPS